MNLEIRRLSKNIDLCDLHPLNDGLLLWKNANHLPNSGHVRAKQRLLNLLDLNGQKVNKKQCLSKWSIHYADWKPVKTRHYKLLRVYYRELSANPRCVHIPRNVKPGYEKMIQNRKYKKLSKENCTIPRKRNRFYKYFK